MKRHLRHWFWVEAGLGLVTGGLAIVTVLWREWIEGLSGVDPDQGSGALEWVIVAVMLAAALSCSLLARSEWRRPCELGLS